MTLVTPGRGDSVEKTFIASGVGRESIPWLRLWCGAATCAAAQHLSNRRLDPIGVGAQISYWAWVGSYRCLSGDALRHRHAEPGHPVEHRAGDPGLGLLAGQSPGAEATTDDGLVPEHGGFPERAPAVADRLLPAQAALVPDHPDVLVALTGRGVSGRARHGRGAGRDDHCRGRVRLALGHGAVDGFAVVGAIGRERGDGAGDLIEQRADQGGVTLLDGGQLAGQDLAAVGIDREGTVAKLGVRRLASWARAGRWPRGSVA